ncbi:MAG: O-antigen ligase family protein [Elusimicrobia bacterium]|nr:O-antigen ligase family protein [Elusimicrobiota bacterium]
MELRQAPLGRMGLYSALFGAPLVFLLSDFFPYSYPKFGLLAGGALLLWAGTWVAPNGAALTPIRTALDLPLAALAAVWIASAQVGLEPAYAWLGHPETLTGVLTLGVGILLYHAGAALPAGERRLPAVVAACAGVALSLHAFLQAAGIDPLPQPAGGLPLGRVIAASGQPVLLGAQLAVAVPLAWTLRRESEGLRRSLWTAALLALGAALLLSKSRGSILGAAAGLSAAWLTAAEAVSPRRRAWALTLVLAGALVAGAAAALRPSAASDAGRVMVWRLAAQAVRRQPLLGAGPEGVRAAALRDRDDDALAVLGASFVPRDAHDDLLHAAATTGLLGLAAYLWLLAALAKALAKARDPAAVGAVTALLIHAKFNAAPPAAWAAAALVSGAAFSHDRSRPWPAAKAAGTVLAVLCFAATAWTWRVDRLHRAATLAASKGDIPRALALFETGARAAAWDQPLRESYAAFLARALPRAPGPAQRTAMIELVARLGRETSAWHPADASGAQMLALAGFLRARTGDRSGLDEAWAAAQEGRRLDHAHLPLLQLGAALARERGDAAAAVEWAGEAARIRALSTP